MRLPHGRPGRAFVNSLSLRKEPRPRGCGGNSGAVASTRGCLARAIRGWRAARRRSRSRPAGAARAPAPAPGLARVPGPRLPARGRPRPGPPLRRDDALGTFHGRAGADIDVRRHVRDVLLRRQGTRGTHGPDRSNGHRRGHLEPHPFHPCPLRGRLRVGPREVGAGREVLDVIVHVLARGERHAGIFDLATGRREQPTDGQPGPQRQAAAPPAAQRLFAGGLHRKHPPWLRGDAAAVLSAGQHPARHAVGREASATPPPGPHPRTRPRPGRVESPMAESDHTRGIGQNGPASPMISPEPAQRPTVPVPQGASSPR